MNLEIRPAPYRIETERLVLRCPEVADVAAIHEGVLASLDVLRPWMPWVEQGDPVSLAERTETIRYLRTGFDRGEDFTYMIYDAADSGFIGGCGLHPRVGPGGLEMGYWIRREAQGRGLAGEAAGALLRTAFEHMNADRVEIRIEPENTASLRVVEKLGVPRESTLRRRFPRGGVLRDIDVFTVFAESFPGSGAAKVETRLFNAAGQPVSR